MWFGVELVVWDEPVSDNLAYLSVLQKPVGFTHTKMNMAKREVNPLDFRFGDKPEHFRCCSETVFYGLDKRDKR